MIPEELWGEVDRRAEWITELCRELIRIPTENPPGDTVGCIESISAHLWARGIPFEAFEPQPTRRSLVATLGDSGGTHFHFNGHADVFPADDPALWTDPPFAGVVREGRIYGRGAADMKGGLTASLAAFLLVQELDLPLRGRLSLAVVADEETGGRWGTRWLLEQRPDVIPDLCLIGEPSATDSVRVGEKGISWITVTSRGRSVHGALSAGEDCITRLAEAITVLRGIVRELGTTPADLAEVVAAAQRHYLNEDYKGREWLLRHPSFNAGVIRGGIKVNVAPRIAEAEIDIRVPFGWTPARALEWARERLAEAEIGEVEVQLSEDAGPPNYTSPEHHLAQTVRRFAGHLTGGEPLFTIATGATDGRFYRARGIPTIIYGPRPQGMGGLDEHILVDDLLVVTKVHLATALAYVGA